MKFGKSGRRGGGGGLQSWVGAHIVVVFGGVLEWVRILLVLILCSRLGWGIGCSSGMTVVQPLKMVFSVLYETATDREVSVFFFGVARGGGEDLGCEIPS